MKFEGFTVASKESDGGIDIRIPLKLSGCFALFRTQCQTRNLNRLRIVIGPGKHLGTMPYQHGVGLFLGCNVLFDQDRGLRVTTGSTQATPSACLVLVKLSKRQCEVSLHMLSHERSTICRRCGRWTNEEERRVGCGHDESPVR